MRLRFATPLALALAITLRLPAQTPMHERIRAAAAELPAGGFVVAESQSGEIRYTVAGKPAPRTDVPPEKIIFEIGSITKVFTGLLLAQAVLDGKAALNDSIAKHLPPEVTIDQKAARITLEQLSMHTSGLPRVPANIKPANPLDPYADYSVENLYAFLRGYHPAQPPPRPPVYSNLGVGLLGHLLARIYGQSYAELLAAKIAQPLGLDDTVIELNEEQQTRFAAPHSGSVQVLPWKLNALAGAGAIRSTGADMLKFGRALLSPTSPIHAAWELARSPHARSKAGLGIGITTRADGKTLYTHNGGTGGFRSYLCVVPEIDRAMVVLLNNDAPEPDDLINTPPKSNPATAAPDPVAETIDPEKLAGYVGVYQLAGQSKFTVVTDAEGRLRIRLTGQPFAPVSPAGPDRFANRSFGAEFHFARGPDDKIVSLTLHQRGAELPAKRTTEPVSTVRFLEAAKLNDYVGRYTLGPMAVFEISTRSGTLQAKLTGQQTYPVHCDRDDHFVYDVVEAALTFERDETGAVIALVLHQDGTDKRAPRAAKTEK